MVYAVIVVTEARELALDIETFSQSDFITLSCYLAYLIADRESTAIDIPATP